MESDEILRPNQQQSEGQCAFYLEKKRRFCRFKPSSNQKYCAEHAGLLGINQGKKRIKCPLNPKHTCFEDMLQKHLKKCRNQQKEVPPYFIAEINSGDKQDQDVTGKIPWEDISSEELKRIIKQVEVKYEEHINRRISQKILHHPCLNEELANKSYGIPAIRHRKQQASLVGHLRDMGLLRSGLCYVELGAGKGSLSHWIQKGIAEETDVAFVLVDRSHVRYKADSVHKWEENGPKFERIRIDIENLHLGKVNSIASGNKPIVAVGKHLCGGATDLALRCVTGTLSTDIDSLTDVPEKKKQKTESGDSTMSDACTKDKTVTSLAGITIALCCHHRCTWKAYTGKKFIQNCGFSPREFQILCKLSSWTAATWTGWKTREEMESDIVSASQQNDIDRDKREGNEGLKSHEEAKSKSDDQEEFSQKTSEAEMEEDEHKTDKPLSRPELNISVQEKEAIGRKCKRLIDYGRVIFLRDKGFECELNEYIESKLTPENVGIFAIPKKLCS